jgi:hypothetical protein
MEPIMNRNNVLATTLFAALTLVVQSAANAESRYGDVGIYGSAWLNFALEQPKVFDMFMYQARLTKAQPDKVAADLRRLSAAGTKVILGAQFFDTRDERGAREGAPPLRELSYYEGLFAPVLSRSDLKIESVAIEEENIPWGGHAELLTGLYQSLKQRYPSQNFYQWYRPRRLPTPPIPGGEWPNLPADGWVIDQYALEGDGFLKYARAIKALGKPVLLVVWACPQWKIGDRGRSVNTSWWNERGWQIFYSQIAVASQEDLPTMFFMFARASGDKEGTTPLYRSTDQCDAKFLERFIADTVPFIKSGKRLPLAPPSRRPDWIPGGCG